MRPRNDDEDDWTRERLRCTAPVVGREGQRVGNFSAELLGMDDEAQR